MTKPNSRKRKSRLRMEIDFKAFVAGSMLRQEVRDIAEVLMMFSDDIPEMLRTAGLPEIEFRCSKMVDVVLDAGAFPEKTPLPLFISDMHEGFVYIAVASVEKTSDPHKACTVTEMWRHNSSGLLEFLTDDGFWETA